jgi:hypothetical protein
MIVTDMAAENRPYAVTIMAAGREVAAGQESERAQGG